MGLLLKECEKCHRDLAKTAFLKTKNPFFPSGTLNICTECIEKMLLNDEYNFEIADKLCQWADLPFDPSKWAELYSFNKEKTFSFYHGIYYVEERQDVDWTQFNTKWREAYKKGELEDKVDLFSAEKLKQLKNKWGPQYDDEELTYLEQLLAGMLQTQNINGKLQMDQALKLCKISLIIDQKIRAEEDFKDQLSNYDKLVKIADFTPKNVKNANDFDSIGEIFAYLEKTGWVNKYYDGVDRDIVDKTVKNIQGWLRHLYVNETSISDDIQRKIEALKLAKQLEDQSDMATDEELDRNDNEAYEFEDEEFLPEIKE